MTSFPEPRPTILTPELARVCAAEMVTDLEAARLVRADDREQNILDIARYCGAHDDGFECAKALENRASWACDFALCEALDDWTSIVRKHIKAAQVAWVERNGIQPTLPVGARVRFRWVSSGGAEALGTITGLSTYLPAAFEVHVDGDPDTRRALIFFEDARPVAAEMEAADARG